ncbi:uncharacterized protein TNCV_3891781 [Trichonephila clavipes]|nr:uncharacterized protein TNCV_3891781 [Trichonephila clavipes]
MGAGDRTGCLRACHLSESYLDVQGSHIMPTAHALYHHRASTSLNSPLLTSKDHGFMRFSPYPYTSISSFQLQTRLIRPGNLFPVMNVPISVLTDTGKEYSFMRCSQYWYTSGPSASKAHIDDVSLNGLQGDTC